MAVYATTNAVLAFLVLAGIIGLLLWSVLTQHRHPGCEDIRLRRRQRQPIATEPASLGWTNPEPGLFSPRR
ncbi:MAG: hypothetical protein ABI355_05595 [Solirubrobacteraceae bacterium]